MEILIKTDGDYENTQIFFNGVEQTLMDFSFSIQQAFNQKYTGKPKMQFTRPEGGTWGLYGMYGEDFKKAGEKRDTTLVMGQKIKQKVNY